MNIQDLKSNTTWQEASNTINNNNNKISLAIATLESAKLKNKGYFTTLEKLNEAIPNPTIGSKAYVGTSEPYAIYIVENGAWVDSGYTGGDEIVAKITTDRIENGAVTTEKIATSAFDSTLSVSGKIAPADVVGKKITDLEHKTGTHITGTWAKYTKVADVDIPIGTTFKNNGGEKLGLSSDSTRAGATKTLNDNETWVSTYAVKSIWCETNNHEGNVDVNIVGTLDKTEEINDINTNIANISNTINNLHVTRANGKLPNFYQSKQVNHISSGANLNDYKDSNILLSAVGVTNNPDSSHNWMIVNSVAPWQDGNRYYCLQYAYRTDDVSVQYVRIYESNSNTFGEWKTLDVGSNLRADIEELNAVVAKIIQELEKHFGKNSKEILQTITARTGNNGRIVEDVNIQFDVPTQIAVKVEYANSEVEPDFRIMKMPDNVVVWSGASNNIPVIEFPEGKTIRLFSVGEGITPYINCNIEISKVSVTEGDVSLKEDIVDNLETKDSTKPLSANMGNDLFAKIMQLCSNRGIDVVTIDVQKKTERASAQYTGRLLPIDISIPKVTMKSILVPQVSYADGSVEQNFIITAYLEDGTTKAFNSSSNNIGIIDLPIGTNKIRFFGGGENMSSGVVCSITGVVTAMLKNHRCFDGKTILFFGDSVTEFDHHGLRYTDFVSELTGANIINLAIGGTSLKVREASSDYNRNWGYVDILNSIKASLDKSSQEYANYASGCSYISSSKPAIMNILNELNNLDWSKVDMVVIAGGSNDWQFGFSKTDTGIALKQCIAEIQTRYPEVKVFVSVPIPRFMADTDFDPTRPDTTGVIFDDEHFSDTWKFRVVNNVKIPLDDNLKDFSAYLFESAKDMKVAVYDAYNLVGINTYNYSAWFLPTDGSHPFLGFEKMGRCISSFLASNTMY